jgi:membrane protease YdiL (CAAX protease family)
VILAVEWAGSLFIAWCGWRRGLEGRWSPDMPDRLIFGPWETAFLSAVDAVLWGPLFEEPGFRGLVHVSLRARLYPVPAALFSALHLYSLTGFLAVCWSGRVFALGFERYRSLLPVMVVQGIGNVLSLGTVLLFYR